MSRGTASARIGFMYDLDPSGDQLKQLPPIKEFTKTQRRVLGTLIEKALTVPESYPLTLKSATAGCNQKSNRHPVTNYTEDAVQAALDELRALGVAAVVHLARGRDGVRRLAEIAVPRRGPDGLVAMVPAVSLGADGQLRDGAAAADLARVLPP